MLNEYEHLLHKYRTRFFDERLAGIGLAGSPGFYLLKIAHASPVKMNVIVEEAPFHKSQATRAIMRLSQCGLVDKTIDCCDQRGFVLEATEAGSKAADAVAKVVDEWDRLLASALDDAEIATLNALTRKMVLKIKDYFEEEKN